MVAIFQEIHDKLKNTHREQEMAMSERISDMEDKRRKPNMK